MLHLHSYWENVQLVIPPVETKYYNQKAWLSVLMLVFAYWIFDHVLFSFLEYSGGSSKRVAHVVAITTWSFLVVYFAGVPSSDWGVGELQSFYRLVHQIERKLWPRKCSSKLFLASRAATSFKSYLFSFGCGASLKNSEGEIFWSCTGKASKR